MTEDDKFVWKAYAERAHLHDPSEEESQIYRLQRLEGIKKRVWATEEEEAESRVEGIDERPEDSNQSADCPSTTPTPNHSWGVDSAETSRCSSEDTISNVSTTNTTIPCSTPPPDALDVPLDAPGAAPILVPSPSACSFSLPLPRLPDTQCDYGNTTYPSATDLQFTPDTLAYPTLDSLPYPTLDIPSLANQDDFRTFGQVRYISQVLLSLILSLIPLSPFQAVSTLQQEEIPELSLPEFQDLDLLNHQLYATTDKMSDEEVKHWADYFLSINTAWDSNSGTQFESALHAQDPAQAQAQAEDFDLSTIDWSTVDCSTIDWKYIQETFPEAYDTVFGEPYVSTAEDLDYDCSTSDLEQGYDSW